MVTAAALCSLTLGLGFGLPAAVGAWHFAQTGEVWTFLGFPTYGGGPFERLGLQTSLPLLIGFMLVCLTEVIVGVMLLRGMPRAAHVSYLLLPFELAFWIGFALPFGPPLGITRTVLLKSSPWPDERPAGPPGLPPPAPRTYRDGFGRQ